MLERLSENNFKNIIVKILFSEFYYNWNIGTWAPIYVTSPEKRESKDVLRTRENLEKRSDSQSVKDASMHLGTRSVQVGLATVGPARQPHRCGASRRARAPQCTAAVESLCRYCRGLSLLALTRDRRPTLSVDCRRC